MDYILKTIYELNNYTITFILLSSVSLTVPGSLFKHGITQRLRVRHTYDYKMKSERLKK